MKLIRRYSILLLIVAVAVVALGSGTAAARPTDRRSVENAQLSQQYSIFMPFVDRNHLLEGLAVDGQLTDGGTFRGTMTVTALGYDPAKGLTVSGVLDGVATTAGGSTQSVQQTFAGVPATLNETSSAGGVSTQQQVCDLLFLDLGPLHLDLLGLTIDLSEIVLDINAVPGAGNLLGNLLCAITGLLDPNGFLSDLIGGLTQLLNLLSQLNQLL